MNIDLKSMLMCMLVMSTVGFFAMGIDKIKAKRKMWRTPEKVLFGIAILGGGLGVWFGMKVFRHKTKHWYFKYGVPIVTVLEFIGLCYIFF